MATAREVAAGGNNELDPAEAHLVRAADGLEGAIIDNATFAGNGGTLLQIDIQPVGLVDIRVDQQRRSGWTRLPTLIGQGYTGRAYIG